MAPADTASPGLFGSGWAPNAENAKICCEFMWAGFRSSDRKQNSGSLLWGLGLNIIGCPDYRIERGAGGASTCYICYWLQNSDIRM